VKKIGFIGYGNMVRVILDGFLLSGVLKPYEVVLSTRTRSKLNDLKETYPEIEIAYDNSSIVLKSNLLFYLLENQM
jgi:pyrroline-5-carboxylate reductase